MTLEDRVTKLEERADANDQAHDDMKQILVQLLSEVTAIKENMGTMQATMGTMFEMIRAIRHDQKHGRWQISRDVDGG